MSHEGLTIDNKSQVKPVFFDVVNEKGDSVSLSDLPPGVRKIVFNKDELIKAKAENKEGKEIAVAKESEPTKEETKKHEEIVLVKKLDVLNGVEKLRGELDALDSYPGELRKEETDTIAREKMAIQEALTGMKQQTAEIHSAQKDLEANTAEVHADSIVMNEKLDQAIEHSTEKIEAKLPQKEEEPSSANAVTSEIFLDPNKDTTEKIIETKELPEEWKGFKKEWFNGYVPQEHEYIDTAKQIMNFSENLASKDPVFRKKLSEQIFEHEKDSDLSNFNGINEEGKLIAKNGNVTNYAYNLVGFSLKRAEYERKLIEAYANEKGLL